MRTIETTATIEPDGTLTVKLPPDIEPGQHHVVLVIDEAKLSLRERAVVEPFPVLQVSAWGYPPDETFRREDMYGDDGR
ncbi:MAG: hypothetical protein M3R24_23165 [Chloroflexota bacterium]|nr:hypothetical protein [Chloroflexota bacterium]